MNSIFLSEAVTTRLSHDLIGNTGAVSNAVELLNEGDDEDLEDVCNILNFSAKVLSRRLKFFRLCFGLSNATVKTVEELYEVVSEYLLTLGNPERPVLLEMTIETPKIHKLIMPAAMMMGDVIVKGGKIRILQNEQGIHISALSDFALNEAKLSNIDLILKGENISENPSAYAPLYYLLEYLKESGVEVKRDKNTLIIGD